MKKTIKSDYKIDLGGYLFALIKQSSIISLKTAEYPMLSILNVICKIRTFYFYFYIIGHVKSLTKMCNKYG